MSKRRILDLTSTKKRDTLRYYDPDTPSSLARTVPSTTFPFSTAIYIFCPTAREANTANEATDRNSSQPFYKGFSEIISMTSNSNAPWRWRRIVFSTRSLRPNVAFSFTSSGYTRVMAPYGDAATISQLFKGTADKDFNDVMDARVDNNRARVLYDKTRLLRSGAGVHHHRFRMYHPLNATLHYDEDEEGDGENTSPWSTTGTKGLGDVFVLDLFNCPLSSNDHALVVKPQATVYWHEK